MRAAIEKGESRPVDPLQTFVTVMGSCLFLPIAQASMVSSLENFGLEPGGIGTFVEDRTEHLVGLIYRGLAAD